MISTRELRPGDVVATYTDPLNGRALRAVDLTLPLRPVVWRTVATVDGDGVVFTDGTSASVWADLVWHRWPRPSDRYAQCDDTCTTDCGACKGAGRPSGTCHLTGQPISKCRHVGGRHACVDLRRVGGGWFTWAEYERIMSD
jgi:hypothetical protein